ncbi:thiamine-phosphate kinase [Candidatus Pelagibacter sp. HIMB1321]|uniref:thiamine-phosphate kinase n=1 Tax=Candidatus Pelagibacter sp. HIMB1321 TaxID=1388755 RepID=UPI000A080C5A|nr:thiamine-phosphate kinase [Candidatus Pelagibacter sp. HIMB1321]SMF75678.1 thiamine-phosphate kinase [Candidatus Pelagibacter sp. HIMB1321]
MHEFDLIKNYFSKLTKNNKSALNLNDDVFFDKSKELVISVDTYNEGIHFPNFDNLSLVIKKILRASISDLICKGVKPKYYFMSGSGNKKSFSKNNLREIAKSLSEEQKKYDIQLCGGDTTFSNKLTFSITVIGFSKKIIFRNKAKINDDIYVTGNIGDSYIGLDIIKKRINLKKNQNSYFIDKYYKPDIQIKLAEELLKFSNTSIDISDGLFADLEKLINDQKASYKVRLNEVPISKPMSKLLHERKLKKIKTISNGDDYQILFTASKNKSRIIKAISKKLKIKITKIGKILSPSNKSSIIDEKGKILKVNNKGYLHHF